MQKTSIHRNVGTSSAVRYSREARARRRQIRRNRRRMLFILITIELFSICLGTLVGYVIGAKPVPATANATEIVTETESADPNAALRQLKIKSSERTLDPELQSVMIEMCEKYNVPFALALAVAEQESKFDPEAASNTGDYGIMQINTVNYDWLRERGIEPLEPKGNVEAGILILSDAINKHKDYHLALMAYNCGDTGAKRLWVQGKLRSDYSVSVMHYYDKWDEIINGERCKDMAYYNECSRCGAALDPGEKCDCEMAENKNARPCGNTEQGENKNTFIL